MKPATQLRLAVVTGAVLLVEALCRTGVIPKFSMIPPSQMAVGLVKLLVSGDLAIHLRSTLVGVAIAAVGSVLVGFLAGSVLHALPRVRRALDPLLATYYAIPIWVFYPLFVVLFGLNNIPKVIIGFLYAVVAMVINTLNGLDRVPPVLRKLARGYGMSAPATAVLVILPSATPYVFTGVKLAIAYSFIGVISSEFILSAEGIGYRISFAYLSFDNTTLYALILLLVVIVSAINLSLFAWERALLQKRSPR